MKSIEQSVQLQFAKTFATSDWSLFKKVAEAHLIDAVKLLKRDIKIEEPLKLLARNSRKRLLIGIGMELLLKAIYLKRGYLINKPPKDSQLKFPFSSQDAKNVQLIPDKTYMLNDLIENLQKIMKLQSRDITLKGIKIAKVFRNKEGHVVTSAHQFDASNYKDIATSLSALYQDAFGQRLTVQFSMAPNEKPIWRYTETKKEKRAHQLKGIRFR